MNNNDFFSSRLSTEPHYFGIGVIGNSIIDTNSEKNKNWYCEILDYQPFSQAIPIKINNDYFEEIPPSKSKNYWRDGVREINKEIYEKILLNSKIQKRKIRLPHLSKEFESEQPWEGLKKVRYTAYYERNPIYRQKALEIHGYTCMACGFNFEKSYGELGKKFIHVHHNKPISQTGRTKINPEKDMSVLCPNCHSMIHRKKNETLSIDELKKIIFNSKN